MHNVLGWRLSCSCDRCHFENEARHWHKDIEKRTCQWNRRQTNNRKTDNDIRCRKHMAMVPETRVFDLAVFMLLP